MKSKRTRRIYSAFRLPAEIWSWLRRAAERSGKTKTRLVVEALRTKMALKEP